MAKKMRSYHFSIGNSSDGPIGFCCRINGTSKKDALETLQAMLGYDGVEMKWGMEPGEYATVYFNPDAISIKDIDEVDEIE